VVNTAKSMTPWRVHGELSLAWFLIPSSQLTKPEFTVLTITAGSLAG
jgi:hypothetical protein